MRSNVENLETRFNELDMLDQHDVEGSVDGAVRRLLYTVLLDSDDVEGIEFDP